MRPCSISDPVGRLGARLARQVFAESLGGLAFRCHQSLADSNRQRFAPVRRAMSPMERFLPTLKVMVFFHGTL